MKIGLIGINRYAKFLNFACNLHAYAFQQFLAKHGYDATFLDYKPVLHGNFDMRHPASYAEAQYRKAITRPVRTPDEKRARKRDLNKWSKLAVGYRSAYVERERRYDKFEAFIAENMIFTEQKYDSDLLEVTDPGFDTYICVTDVIWQSIPTHKFDRGFLLGSKAFEGKQKIAYAASRGASKDFTENEANLFFDYLADYDAISVRERDFGKYIEENSQYSAPTVMDPTLLHDKEFWQEVATKPREERYVLLYYVMEQAVDTIEKAVEYAKKHDLTLVELSDRPFKHGKVTDPDVKHVSRYDVGLDEWLGYIEHAEAVFTNSFHGCCFSLIFETPFFAGRRNGQKVPNFLATFGLEAQRFGPETSVDDFNPNIDFDAAKRILDAERQVSVDFILSALKAAEEKITSGQKKDTSHQEAKRRTQEYPAHFHSGYGGEVKSLSRSVKRSELRTKHFDDGSFEYMRPGARFKNSGTATVTLKSLFRAPEHKFDGWTLRFRIDNRWFWYLDDGSIAEGDEVGSTYDNRKALIPELGVIPHLPVNKISVVVFVARWSKDTSFRTRARKVLDHPAKIPAKLLKRARRTVSRAYRKFK